MTELARSVRFQAHSSVLVGSAPAANYKPNRPQLTQETSHPANPSRVRKKRSSTDIESNFPPMPAQMGGAETEMGAGCKRCDLDAHLGVFCSGLMYGSVLFLKRVALPNWNVRSSPLCCGAWESHPCMKGFYCNTQELCSPRKNPLWPKVLY